MRQSIGLYDSGGLELARGALEAADDAASSGDLAELCLANRRFHQLLYEPCPNQLLRKTLDDLQDQVALISVGGWRRRSTWEDESREHRSILAAVEDENGEQAEDEVRSHIAKFFVGQLLAPELATVPLAAELWTSAPLRSADAYAPYMTATVSRASSAPAERLAILVGRLHEVLELLRVAVHPVFVRGGWLHPCFEPIFSAT